MAYVYDIFVSYKREPKSKRLVSPWLRGVLDRVEFYLRQDLGGRDVRIFFDEDSIEVGSEWPSEIKDALLATRCLLPIWSPEYFQSKWCMTEWGSFVARQRQLKRTDGVTRRLIFPLTYHDGQWFPPQAKSTQQFDLRDYTATTAAFWDSAQAWELDQIIKNKLSPSLAAAVLGSPSHREWPIRSARLTQVPRSVGLIRL
jgi:TIR domain